jgi:hypothetical protein
VAKASAPAMHSVATKLLTVRKTFFGLYVLLLVVTMVRNRNIVVMFA